MWRRCTRLHFLLQADLLRRLTRAELQDLLLVAVNLQQRTLPAAHILDYDRQRQQLLYASRQTGAQRAARSNSSHNSSSSSSSSSQLVDHLITTAVIRRRDELAATLAATPAAAQLSEHAIAQLLYLSLHLDGLALGCDDLGHIYPLMPAANRPQGPPSFTVLLGLPSAQAICSSSLASLLQLAAKQSRFRHARYLFALPAAQQLSSQQVFEVLLEALQGKYGGNQGAQRWLLENLIALPAARQLPAGAAVQLLELLLGDAKERGSRDYAATLAPLQLGSQLTGSEALQLLQAAAESGSAAAVKYAFTLSPAVDEVLDGEGFAAFLQAVLQHVDGHRALAADIMRVPVVQHLQPDAVFNVLACGVNSRRDGRMMCDTWQCVFSCLMQHAAVSSFSAAMLQELLLEAAAQQRLEHVAELLQAPAAAQLSVQVVATLLEHAAAGQPWVRLGDSGRNPNSSSELLLALPAVQQLPEDAVVRICAAAVKVGHVSTVRRVCSLAAAQQASTEAAVSMLQRAAQGQYYTSKYDIWCAVLQGLPQLAGPSAPPCDQLQLTSQQLLKFLLGAVNAGDSNSITLLCRYAAGAAAAGMSPSSDVRSDHGAAVGMQELLLAAIRQLHASDKSITIAAVEHLFQLRAAQALKTGVVASLLRCCIDFRSAEAVQLVGLLPAAQQLDQQVCNSLVHAALKRFDKAVLQLGTPARAEQVLRNVLQLPAVQRLGHVLAVRLLVTCMHLYNHNHKAVLLLHSSLPAAQQAAQEPATVRHLLLSAFALHQYETFNWLQQLPAAPLDDGEVAMLCAVRVHNVKSDKRKLRVLQQLCMAACYTAHARSMCHDLGCIGAISRTAVQHYPSVQYMMKLTCLCSVNR
jgi:hypothetical protein